MSYFTNVTMANTVQATPTTASILLFLFIKISGSVEGKKSSLFLISHNSEGVFI